VQWLAAKTGNLRIFVDEEGGWTKDVAETGGEVLVVSQFTLLASTKKGTKPSWHRAAKPEVARPMCEAFVGAVQAFVGAPVQSGRFGAMMEVALVNDGPVTLLLEA
jgi:D-tyrosyl-tRNA(Tyr) deacylase